MVAGNAVIAFNRQLTRIAAARASSGGNLRLTVYDPQGRSLGVSMGFSGELDFTVIKFIDRDRRMLVSGTTNHVFDATTVQEIVDPSVAEALQILLLCSPEIVKEYEARYGSQTSLIASCMRGASVTRSANLVLLCTTSLYGSSLNQYSRIKLPAEMIGGQENTAVEYKCVGVSDGYGTFHFSKDTLRMMATLIGRSNESRKVNRFLAKASIRLCERYGMAWESLVCHRMNC